MIKICIALIGFLMIASIAHAQDARANRFCAALSSNETPPIANKIYYRDGNAVVELADNTKFRRGRTELFFYRKREDVGSQPGAIMVRLKYRRATAGDSDTVVLFNNSKEVSCRTPPAALYEGFHGEANTPSRCIQTQFHQGYVQGDLPFRTMDPVERRREFAFGTKPSASYGFSLGQLFSGFTAYATATPAAASDTSGPAYRYRSQIYNYAGQREEGSCIRFVLFSDRDDLSVDLDLSDLLEAEQREFVRVGVRGIEFTGN